MYIKQCVFTGGLKIGIPQARGTKILAGEYSWPHTSPSLDGLVGFKHTEVVGLGILHFKVQWHVYKKIYIDKDDDYTEKCVSYLTAT